MDFHAVRAKRLKRQTEASIIHFVSCQPEAPHLPYNITQPCGEACSSANASCPRTMYACPPIEQNRTVPALGKAHTRSILQDCFYASVFENEAPHLKTLPLAVQQKQIVVTCNYEARRRVSQSSGHGRPRPSWRCARRTSPLTCSLTALCLSTAPIPSPCWLLCSRPPC
jgi:hypothetical protein